MDKLTFMKKAFLWVAIISAIAFVFVGIFSPVLEATVFGHIMKTVFGWAWVTLILETLTYVVGQVIYDWKHRYKEKYGKGWFWKGIKEDLQWMKEHFSWKKAGKVVLTFIIFFAIFFGIVWLLELIVP